MDKVTTNVWPQKYAHQYLHLVEYGALADLQAELAKTQAALSLAQSGRDFLKDRVAEFEKDPESPPRRFFRKQRTVADLRELAKQDFTKFKDELYQEHFGECAESCEPFMEPV